MPAISINDDTRVCGRSPTSLLNSTFYNNATYDQSAWEMAKREACMPCPGSRPVPQYPPKWVYPTSDANATGAQEILGAPDARFQETFAPPFAEGYQGALIPPPRPSNKDMGDAVMRELERARFQVSAASGNPVGMPSRTASGANGAPLIPERPIPVGLPMAVPESGAFLESDGRFSNPMLFKTTNGSSPSDATTPPPTTNSSIGLLGFAGNAAKGVLYDLAHWSHVPGESAADKMHFVFCRDERLVYLSVSLVACLFVALLVAAIAAAICARRRGKTTAN